MLDAEQLGSTRKGMTRHCPLGAYGLLEDRKGAIKNSEFMGALGLGSRIKTGFSGAAISYQASI